MTLADSPPRYNAPEPSSQYPDVDPVYQFNYNVYNQENYEHQNFNQQEDRNGYETHGEYSVLLADGRTQRVVYKVIGDSEFVADVTYEGEAKEYVAPAPKPVYSKPAPKPVYEPAYKPAAPATPSPVYYKPAPTYAPPTTTAAPTPAPTYAPPTTTAAYKPAPTPAYIPREYAPVRFNPFG